MVSLNFEISGPGPRRAMQEAVKAKKNIVFVCDYDSLGRVLRVGYIFKNRKEKEIPRNQVKWFKKDEVSIVQEKHSDKEQRKASLRVEYALPPDRDKKERQFLLRLPLGKSNDMRLRNIFRLRGNLIKSFVVQSEIRVTEKGKEIWKPIVRYDCAHDFIHRDLINRNGKKIKEKLSTQNFKSAIRIAIEEMKNNLRPWLVRLGYEAIIHKLFVKINVDKELEDAKEYLLRLVEHPDLITKTPFTFVQVKEDFDYVERIWAP